MPSQSDLSLAASGNLPRSWISRATGLRVLTAAAFILGAAVLLAAGPFSHVESGDDSIYDYIAQSIVRGQVPYRDVIDPKTPGSAYLSAGAMAAGRAAGIRDIIAVRWLHVLLAGFLSAITFLVAQTHFEDRLTACVAFLVPLTINGFSPLMIRGTQPKLSMIVFGMFALLFIAKDKPFWAGFTSMLSFLCWQPGLMFTGVAFLILSRYLTCWRDGRAVRVVLGAALPLAALLLYFYSRSALGDLWSWTILYPYGVFAPESATPLGQSLQNLWRAIRSELQSDSIIAPFALVGLLVYAVTRVRRRIRNKEGVLSKRPFRDAIVYPPLLYLAFCVINFQGGPDLIPFLPFIGLFTAWLFVEAARAIARRVPRGEIVTPLAATVLISMLILVRDEGYARTRGTLQDQDREAQIVASYLGPGDRIYVHGVAELLVLLNAPNLNKYIAFDTGADNYIASQKSGGFLDVINEIEMEAPRIVAMTRLRNVRHRDDLQNWVEEHYDKLDFALLRGIYVRKREPLENR